MRFKTGFLYIGVVFLIGILSCQDEEEFGTCPCVGDTDRVPWYKGCGYINDCEEAYSCAQNSMLNQVYKTIKYPAEARENSVQGTIVVEFVVDIFGSMDNVDVQSDTLGFGIPEAAIEGVMSLSEVGFYPALEDCESVEYTYILPIKFKLE